MLHRIAASYLYGIAGVLRSPGAVFWNLMFPVVMMVLYGSLFGGRERSPELLVLDLDRSAASARLAALTQEYTGSRLVRLDILGRDLDAYVAQHSVPRVLVIPSGFANALRDSAESLALEYRANDQPSSYAIMGGIYAASNVINFELIGARPKIALRRTQLSTTSRGASEFYASSVLGMSLMYTGMFGMGLVTSTLRRARIFKKFASTPLRRWEWIVARAGVLFTLTCVSGLLVLIAGGALYGTAFRISPLLVPILLCGLVCFGSIGVVIGGVGQSPEATAGALNAIALPMLFLSGTFIDIEALPRLLSVVVHALPLTYVNAGIRDVMVYENVHGGLVNLAWTAAYGIVLLVLSAQTLKWRQS